MRRPPSTVDRVHRAALALPCMPSSAANPSCRRKASPALYQGHEATQGPPALPTTPPVPVPRQPGHLYAACQLALRACPVSISPYSPGPRVPQPQPATRCPSRIPRADSRHNAPPHTAPNAHRGPCARQRPQTCPRERPGMASGYAGRVGMAWARGRVGAWGVPRFRVTRDARRAAGMGPRAAACPGDPHGTCRAAGPDRPRPPAAPTPAHARTQHPHTRRTLSGSGAGASRITSTPERQPRTREAGRVQKRGRCGAARALRPAPAPRALVCALDRKRAERAARCRCGCGSRALRRMAAVQPPLGLHPCALCVSSPRCVMGWGRAHLAAYCRAARHECEDRRRRLQRRRQPPLLHPHRPDPSPLTPRFRFAFRVSLAAVSPGPARRSPLAARRASPAESAAGVLRPHAFPPLSPRPIVCTAHPRPPSARHLLRERVEHRRARREQPRRVRVRHLRRLPRRLPPPPPVHYPSDAARVAPAAQRSQAPTTMRHRPTHRAQCRPWHPTRPCPACPCLALRPPCTCLPPTPPCGARACEHHGVVERPHVRRHGRELLLPGLPPHAPPLSRASAAPGRSPRGCSMRQRRASCILARSSG